jgi:hypothetical protein
MRALSAREDRARELAARCIAAVADPPRLAVPDVEALGPVPHDRAGLDAYLKRLGTVARALEVVERAYGTPLDELDELRGLLGGYLTRAARTGRAADPTVARAAAAARAAFETVPTRVGDVRALVTRFADLVRTPTSTPPPLTPGVPS